MEVALVAIAKNENPYINEWCHYYINLGFSHIYLYDNNDKKTPFVGDFIDQELKDRITIIPKAGWTIMGTQQMCYMECYRNYKFDWLLFCDIDEFLIGIDNVQEFLAQDKFKDVEQIKILWKLYGDSDIIERDITQPVFGSFTKLADRSLYKHRSMVKCFVKGGLLGLQWSSVHIVSRTTPLRTCLPSGKLCSKEGCTDEHIEPFDDYSGETVYINHYITKSLQEFLVNKYLTEDPCFIGRTRTLNYFWKYNEKTPEKEAYIDKFLAEHNLERREKNARYNT